MSTIGLTIALLLASPSAAEAPASEALQEAAGQEVIAGEADGFERRTVPVRIGGHGTYRFIIDTGSQRTVLSTELASRLALPSLAKRRVMGIAGSEIAETATVEELGLGRRSFSDLLVVLFEARHIGAGVNRTRPYSGSWVREPVTEVHGYCGAPGAAPTIVYGGHLWQNPPARRPRRCGLDRAKQTSEQGA